MNEDRNPEACPSAETLPHPEAAPVRDPLGTTEPTACEPASAAADNHRERPAPDPAPELLNKVLEQLAVLTQKVTFCEQAIAKRIKDDFVKEKAFNVLYDELKQYKDNFIFESQKPLFRSLMLLYDDMVRTSNHTQSKRVKQAIQTLREELEEIFARNEIETIENSPRKFDNQFQQAIKAEPTREAAEDMDVLQVVRCGFRRKQYLLRPQEVVVKRFQPF